MLLKVLLKWTNHLLKKFVERAAVHILKTPSLQVDRNLTPHDASPKVAEGFRKVFRQKFICDFLGTAAGPPQRGHSQAGRPCDIPVGRAVRFGFKADSPSSPDILQMHPRPLVGAAI